MGCIYTELKESQETLKVIRVCDQDRKPIEPSHGNKENGQPH